MWRITAFDRDGREVARYELEAGEITIGRDPDRQLVLQSPSVSRRHCKVRIEATGPAIYDEGSANGVLVNGMRITSPTPINQVSRIEVAEFRLQVEQVGVQQAPMPMPGMPGMGAGSGVMPAGMMPQMGQPMQPMGQPMGVPMAMGQPMSGVMPAMPQGVNPAMSGMMAATPGMPMSGVMPAMMQPMGQDQVRLIAEGGPYDGTVYDLPMLPEIAVGRAVDNNLVLDDPSLSRKHSRMRRLGGGRLEVEDVNSANGTYVNGRKITKAQVGPGDTLRFGEVMFRVDGGAVGQSPSAPRVSGGGASNKGVVYGFYGLCAAAVLVYGAVLYTAVSRPSGPPPGAVEEAIAKRVAEAKGPLAEAQSALDKQEWARAKAEAAKALDIDPANLEASKVHYKAERAENDEKTYKKALASMGKDSVDQLREAVSLFESLGTDSQFHGRLAQELSQKLLQAGGDLYRSRKWRDAASVLCDAYRVMLDKSRFGGAKAQLRDAEKKGKATATCQLDG